MSFAQVRAYIETRVAAAFPGITVVYENVQETPPPLPYVICLISYPSTTEPVLCQTESMIENLQGNLQLSCYAERGVGMGPLEYMGAQAVSCMNNMYDWNNFHTVVKCGQVQGPVPVLGGASPYGVVTVSCPFTAAVLFVRQGILTTEVGLVDL